MDQEKIGKFISDNRKKVQLTQEQLAFKMGVSKNAVSKWERGLCLPDTGIMILLCDILKINVNELLSGEKLNDNNYNAKAEEKLLEMIKIKEHRDRELLICEIFIGVFISINLFIFIFLSAFVSMQDWLRVFLIIIGIIPFTIGILYLIRIEQIAGYYECNNCHYKYIPSYKKVLFAPHINRTRKMKCPKCNKKSWHKKVLNI